MRIFAACLSALAFFALLPAANAQIQVSAQTERTNYLLYERVDVLVTIQNMSDSDILLGNNEGHPWLSFIVAKHDHLPVRPERESTFAPLTLKMGTSKTLRVNLTPLFSFREEGEYQTQVVIDLPGAGQILSQAVPFVVTRGHTVWSQVRPVDSSQRTYSLIRFSSDADTTRLYLRVEDPSENVVYANYSLGEIASSTDPGVLFDPAGNLHILQPIALSTYLYSRTDADGKILNQTVFKSGTIRDPSGALKVPPRLQKLADGNVIVMGGQAEDPNAPRDRLSDSQPDSRRAQPVALPVSSP